MRIVSVICLVLLCMAATIRVDGVWPPPALDARIETALSRISHPGRTLTTWLGSHGLRLLDPGAPVHGGESVRAAGAVLATRRSEETDHGACS